MSNDMTTRHTAGLLEVRRETAIDYRPNLIYGNEGGSLVAVLQGGGPRRAITGPEEDANARRLVACWNAVISLSTDEIESVNVADILAQNNALTGALKGNQSMLMESAKQHRERGDIGHAALCDLHIEQARAALTKASAA